MAITQCALLVQSILMAPKNSTSSGTKTRDQKKDSVVLWINTNMSCTGKSSSITLTKTRCKYNRNWGKAISQFLSLLLLCLTYFISTVFISYGGLLMSLTGGLKELK